MAEAHPFVDTAARRASFVARFLEDRRHQRAISTGAIGNIRLAAAIGTADAVTKSVL
jgi:hypothetical protein